MTDHTIRIHRRFHRWITVECEECHAVLLRGFSGEEAMNPARYWQAEQDHRRRKAGKPPAVVHHPQ